MKEISVGKRSPYCSSTSNSHLPVKTATWNWRKNVHVQAFLDYLLQVLGLSVPPPTTHAKPDKKHPIALASNSSSSSSCESFSRPSLLFVPFSLFLTAARLVIRRPELFHQCLLSIFVLHLNHMRVNHAQT